MNGNLTIVTLQSQKPIINFSAARNEALQKAKTEWVLFIDSDEEISSKLRKEIIEAISAPAVSSPLPWSTSTRRGVGTAGFGRTSDFSNEKSGSSEKYAREVAFYLKRKDRFLGQWLNYGETAHVRLLRLARKNAGYWERPVHEVWRVKGEIGQLKNPILHYSHNSIDEMLAKIDCYSEIEAKYRKETLLHCYIAKLLIEIILFPAAKFVQNYIFRLGFLDGMAGFIHAGMMSFHSFLVRAKQVDKFERHLFEPEALQSRRPEA